MLLSRFGGTLAGLVLCAGVALAQGKLTDPQIAHIAYTAGEIDIKAAQLALEKSRTRRCGLSRRTWCATTGGKRKGAGLVKKLGVTPEDNDTSKALVRRRSQARRARS